jgi:hypothetical protein
MSVSLFFTTGVWRSWQMLTLGSMLPVKPGTLLSFTVSRAIHKDCENTA